MNIHTVFIILISASLALGTYGVVVQRGACLMRIDARTTLMAVIWGALELAAALLGYSVGSRVLLLEMGREHSTVWVRLIAGMILASIGIRMLCKAFRGRSFLEHRMENVNLRADALLSLRLCVHGCFAAIACGLLRCSLAHVLIAAFVINTGFAVIGYITGRVWGVAPSGKAYALGGSLLCALSIALQLVEMV
ncbi:MAG: manganese efflux pump [Eubacteriales bacterium]|nr:manganese efflux pump [Eubacteriales bacterium]